MDLAVDKQIEERDNLVNCLCSTGTLSQIAPYTLYSVCRDLVKSSALDME